MITIKNRLNQPLVINVPQEPAIYLFDKEKKTITNDQYNAPEMQRYIELDYILVLSLS